MIHKIPSQILYSITKKYLAGGTEYINQFNDPKPQLDNFKLKASIPRNVFYSKQISTEEGASYLIVLNSSIAPVNATVTTLRTQLIYITMIMLLLSFALSIRISKNISDPIIEINNKSKLFAKGEYDVSFEEKGYLEIAELAQTLNYSAKELSKVENLRRELIANISHDLRTPLTMIIGYSEVIRDLPNENTPENVQVIIDEAKRLASLVNDVLDISKLQSGSQKLNKTEFNLTKTIEDILTRYAKFTEKDGYTIKFEKDTDFIVTADELRITQVIYNLINNAITYTGPDKSVTIRQTVTDGKVKIEVIDTGEGIAPENIPYIWDRYYKVNDSHKRAQIGTGLGLSIVKAVIERHNGTVKIESNENTYTKIMITIPEKIYSLETTM
jgi:signal transduction histidine kinase